MKNIIKEYWGTKTKDQTNYYKLPFTVDASFEKTLFMDTPLIGEYLKQIDKSHRGSLYHWVGGLMHITVKTCYNLQYLTMSLSGYMNAPIEPALLAFIHGIEYLIHHPHEPIMYSTKKFSKKKIAHINVSSKQGM